MVTARAILATFVLSAASLWAQTVNPVPLINQPLVPSSIAPGSAQFSLTVEGTGFVAASIVEWNRVPLATTFVDQGKLTATVPAGDVGSNGTAEVTVTNPAPGGGTSNAMLFTITIPTTMVTFAASPPAGTVLVADFNHDGIADLLVTATGGGSILLGNGDGTFTLKSQISLATSFLVGAVAGDFNGDGEPDIATISDPNCMGCAEVTIFVGHGDGTFTSTFQTDGLDGDYYSIATADFNRDGNLDLVVTGVAFGINFLDVLIGTGSGTFVAGTGFSPPDIGSPDAVAIGDFDGDGILDLAADNPFAIFLGKGDGTFSPLPQPSTLNVGSGVLTGDFNGDGILDLAFGGDATTGNLGILLGKGDGTFTQQTSVEPPATGSVSAVGDLNGDGKLDLIVNGSVYLGNGDGTFQDGVATTGTGAAFVGDFNRDGRLDLAFANAIFLQVPAIESARTTTTLTSSANPAFVHQSFTLSARVTAQTGGIPSGSVIFYSGPKVFATVALVNGVATLHLSFSHPGVHHFTASYSGDTNFHPSVSPKLTERIRPRHGGNHD